MSGPVNPKPWLELQKEAFDKRMDNTASMMDKTGMPIVVRT